MEGFSQLFKCNICEKRFSKRRNFKYHHNTVHIEATYSCSICTKSYQTKSKLIFHKKTVHEGKKFKCETCGNSFSQKINLKTHNSRVHEGHKNYKCESCEKSFSGAQYFILKSNFIQFMRYTKITNVNLVKNHFPLHNL